jgi:hypothetical protein
MDERLPQKLADCVGDAHAMEMNVLGTLLSVGWRGQFFSVADAATIRPSAW